MTCNPIFLEDAKDKLRIVNLMFQVKFEDQIRVTKFEPFELYNNREIKNGLNFHKK